MRFEVPQFIEIEDKIIGPFTFRQFIYLAGGVGFAIVLFLVAPRFIAVVVGLPLGALAGFLAFYKVNNRPFSMFLESMLEYFRKSRLYLWRKRGTGIYDGVQNISAESETAANYIPKSNNGNLSSLSRKLELKAIQKEQ